MNSIAFIKDCTLKNSETDKSLNITFKEKLEIAAQLDRINTHVIETGYAGPEQSSFIAIKTIANTLKNSILCCPSEYDEKSIENTWNAIKGAKKRRIHISLPVSTVNMEYILNMKKDRVAETVEKSVLYAKSFCNDVEFTALDATRADRDFLIEILHIANKSGADIIGVEDTQGQMLPDEIFDFISFLKNNLELAENTILSFRPKNDLGLATANMLSAIKAGVTQSVCSVNGTGNDASMEEVVNAIIKKNEAFNISCSMDTSRLNRASIFLANATGTKESLTKTVHRNEESGVRSGLIEKDIDFYEFRKSVEQAGYMLTDTDIQRVFDSFTDLASKKQFVYFKDIEAIIARQAVQVPGVYKLDSFVINSGNKITSTATVKLNYKDNLIEGVETGDGPIDAAFHVMEKIMGMNLELFDFGLKSVTEGKDALGAATVKIRSDGKIYIGKGLSTDVIESSILAYINAVNKMLYEENLE